MPLLYHAYVYLEFLILACTIYILASNPLERRAKPMSIVDFIAAVGFGLTCFSIGYTFGKDNHKPQK